MITQVQRENLNYAVRAYLIEQCKKTTVIQESKSALLHFIAEEATYEQVLNLALNKERDSKYFNSETLEEAGIFLIQNELGTVFEEVAVIPETVEEKYHMMENTLIESSPSVYITEDAFDSAKKALKKAGKAVNKSSITKYIKSNYKDADKALKKMGRRNVASGSNKKLAGSALKGVGSVKKAGAKILTKIEKRIGTIKGSDAGWARDKLKSSGGKNIRKGLVVKGIGSTQKAFGDLLAKDGMKAVGKIGSAVAAGAAAGILAHYVYKHYVTAAGKQCKNKKGDEFKKCYDAAKKSSMQKALNALRTASSKCSSDRDPKKCKMKYAKEIAKMQNKISKAR